MVDGKRVTLLFVKLSHIINAPTPSASLLSFQGPRTIQNLVEAHTTLLFSSLETLVISTKLTLQSTSTINCCTRLSLEDCR